MYMYVCICMYTVGLYVYTVSIYTNILTHTHIYVCVHSNISIYGISYSFTNKIWTSSYTAVCDIWCVSTAVRVSGVSVHTVLSNRSRSLKMCSATVMTAPKYCRTSSLFNTHASFSCFNTSICLSALLENRKTVEEMAMSEGKWKEN